jgi:hypothetical protein
MFFGIFDWTIILLIPAFMLAAWAQYKVKRAYSKWSEVPSSMGLTGAEVSRQLLRRADLLAGLEKSSPAAGLSAASLLEKVRVQLVPGTLTDHYDPSSKILRLSEEVHSSTSLAAIGVAAHETGHAVQDALHYPALVLRTGMVPVAQLGSGLAWPLLLLGFIMRLPALIDIGILLFAGAVVFTLVTLPVEFDASRRAMVLLRDGGFVTEAELKGVREVLGAAALTYVAAAAVAILQLIRLLLIRSERD